MFISHIIELKERQSGADNTSVAAAHNNLAVFYCCIVNMIIIITNKSLFH